MTRDEFISSSIALLRTALGWQSAIARRLGVKSRTVRRWLKTGEIPPWVDAEFAKLTGMAQGPWPRDEWAIADAIGAERSYIVHLTPPRFSARVVRCVETEEGAVRPAEEQPVDIVSGAVYIADGSDPDDLRVLCEIDWIDEVPTGQATQWLEAAADALERAENGQ